ncbi:MAG: beta-xylosidase [Gemmatimonadota bacterium]|nr:beta-xylosidase [Gemmatimonadota bacterium]
MTLPLLRAVLTLAAIGSVCLRPLDAQAPRDITIRVDASRDIGELRPVWRFFGADEPNYAYMKDGRRLLAELGELRPHDVYFRAHNLLTSGDGTPALKWGSTNAYTEDAAGHPIYDWTIVDRIFDTYLARGVRPYVEIGFMPKALSTRPEPYEHEWRPGSGELYTGWAYPPNDYGKWGELVFQLTKHCIAKYGIAEVRGWYWETWNEPNIGYWKGSREEFFKLHDVTLAAVRRALPDAHVVGPHMAGSDAKWLTAYFDHVFSGSAAAGQPTPQKPNFLSFHPKGSPTTVDGHVRMGIATQLQVTDRNFATIASNPEAKKLPIILGESDPEGCAACQGAALAYRNGTMYSSYTAASMARIEDLAIKHGLTLEGALTWAFEFEDHAYFPGFRVLASNGIDHPVLNVFRMMSRMPGRRLQVESTGALSLDEIVAHGVRGEADVSATASRGENRIAVLAWHYHDDDVAGPTANVHLVIDKLPPIVASVTVTHYRIDDEHSNAFAAWKRMGSPVAPNNAQYAALKAAGGLAELVPVSRAAVASGAVVLNFPLPRQGVSLVILDWSAVRP